MVVRRDNARFTAGVCFTRMRHDSTSSLGDWQSFKGIEKCPSTLLRERKGIRLLNYLYCLSYTNVADIGFPVASVE
jgi:hypothetical protein